MSLLFCLSLLDNALSTPLHIPCSPSFFFLAIPFRHRFTFPLLPRSLRFTSLTTPISLHIPPGIHQNHKTDVTTDLRHNFLLHPRRSRWSEEGRGVDILLPINGMGHGTRLLVLLRCGYLSWIHLGCEEHEAGAIGGSLVECPYPSSA